MSTATTKVWYLRNGDLEQIVACDQATAMQLLGTMSGYIGELLPQMDPEGSLQSLACRYPGTVFTKHYDQPIGAWSARAT